jgi:hypothetical protein
MRKLLATFCAVTALAAAVVPEVSAADILCGYYDGRRVCTPIRRTGPAKPTTHPTMTARATPKTVKVGDSVKLWMGPKRGQNGFVSGEVVRFFDLYKGDTDEITGIRDSIKGGIARWSRQYLSLPGVDQTGVHHLCAMGERSGKLACVKVTVVWGSGSAPNDSYNGVGGDTYGGVVAVTTIAPPVASPTTPTTTAAPAPSTTVASGFAPPNAGGGFSAPVAG